MVLRRPVKYNPDKKDFVLTESNLNNFEKAQGQPLKSLSGDDIFETNSELSRTDSHISYGNRVSQFGFTDMFGQTKQSQPQQEEFKTKAEPVRQKGQVKQASNKKEKPTFGDFEKLK